ncbi:hypothetical protein [Actinomyces lilanjuaniae]|uniref:hypothetical protein n=1 Tax=Actinomyces lilanjuaniae TaxID=2321394 RepID=UPI0019695C34|nr:hypothetical protein [Actinomyces lilanjuaniae]
MPKMRTEAFSPGDQTWLGSLHGTDAARTVTLDPADFTAQAKDGVIPSGTALAHRDGRTVPWDPAAAEALAGFLLTDQPADRGRVAAPLVDRVRVVVGRLPDAAFEVPAPDRDATACTYVPREA